MRVILPIKLNTFSDKYILYYWAKWKEIQYTYDFWQYIIFVAGGRCDYSLRASENFPYYIQSRV